ncbi:MAG: hypothetical protein WA395_12080 [Nitrososphaeraceae archaeon]
MVRTCAIPVILDSRARRYLASEPTWLVRLLLLVEGYLSYQWSGRDSFE